MRFGLIWNPFSFLNAAQPDAPARGNDSSLISSTDKEATAMADVSEFELPSAILAAALVEKSELKGTELATYAVDVQRIIIRQMMAFREKMEAERS